MLEPKKVDVKVARKALTQQEEVQNYSISVLDFSKKIITRYYSL